MICPYCKQPVVKRVAGKCPQCGTAIEGYRGYWYRAGTGSPALALLKHFEVLVSERMSKVAGRRVIFVIPPAASRYKRELVASERLLVLAGHDLDLAKSTLDTLFRDHRFNRKERNTMIWIEDDFVTALAITRTYLTALEEILQQELRNVTKVNTQEDIFA